MFFEKNLTICIWMEIYLNTTHPLPHKVVGQVSSQHVRTEGGFHHTLVNLKHRRNSKGHNIIIILSFEMLGGLEQVFFIAKLQWLELPWELTWLQLSPVAQREQYHNSQTWPPYPPEDGWQGQRQHDKKCPGKKKIITQRHTFIPAGLCCRCWAGPSVSSWTLHTEIRRKSKLELDHSYKV